MSDQSDYEKWLRSHLAASIAKGHKDPANLRELLICTTLRTTVADAEAYFVAQHQDPSLVETLIKIALEGEDAGDAPWAAANVLLDFPSPMLRKHQAALQKLASHPWAYLSEPAKKALEKIISDDP
jgi:hypothetical protein